MASDTRHKKMQGKPYLLPFSVIMKQSTATETERGNDQGREEKFIEKLEESVQCRIYETFVQTLAFRISAMSIS